MIFKYACRLFIMFFLMAVLTGCFQLEGVGTTHYESSKGALNKIAVVPFQQTSPEDVAAGLVRCPLCGSVFRVDKLSDGSENMVENIFIEHLKRYETFQIIPAERVHSAYDRIVADADSSKTGLTNADILRRIGDELGADGVVVGYVYRYRERVGYPYAVKQPASVTFHIHLIEVDNGAIVWKGDFDKTQKSLMENMFRLSFFYREKGRWLTAEELTEEGIREVLKTFPGIR